MARKSNKTAHVLSLLTNDKSKNDLAAAKTGESPAAKSPNHKPKVPIQTKNDDEVAELIKSKLMQEMDDDAPSSSNEEKAASMYQRLSETVTVPEILDNEEPMPDLNPVPPTIEQDASFLDQPQQEEMLFDAASVDVQHPLFSDTVENNIEQQAGESAIPSEYNDKTHTSLLPDPEDEIESASIQQTGFHLQQDIEDELVPEPSQLIAEALQAELEQSGVMPPDSPDISAETETSPPFGTEFEDETTETAPETALAAPEALPYESPVIPSETVTGISEPQNTEKRPEIMPVTFEDFGNPEEEENYIYVNVLEEIVTDKVLDYMKKFGVCTCKRCVADTTALALTNLPSKYVVAEAGNTFPLLNYYTNKYSSSVIAEITKACLQVDAVPHHEK